MQEFNSNWWNQLCHGLMTWLTSIHPSLHPTYIHLKKRRRKRKKTRHKSTAHLSLSLVSPPPRETSPPPPTPLDSGLYRRPLPPLFPSLRPDPPLAAPRAHPRPLPMARVSRVASPPTPACRWRLCSALFDAHRKSHGRLRLVVGAPAPGGCGADARGG